MTCEPFCDSCGGNLGRSTGGGDWTCAKCKLERLRRGRKERIRKDEFDAGNPMHFRLQSRGGAWRYYKRVDAPTFVGIDYSRPGGDMSVRVTRRGDEIISIEELKGSTK